MASQWIRHFILPKVARVNFYSTQVQKCTLIPGDGIGPEISAAVQKIFEAAEVTRCYVISN
ncbi:probable isocitrate dehydrogenase [NAD] subunit alpha, mitochondrial [Copidosoma floridanum]|uniref:probable isocitrate dehydrogenase [NAD] subunit alpha, mitochondrial n=1 Tax=Copidosoma floridanum TaxID=29053 RepID=UPI0006C9C0DB|nr:probable isocitrate dehydrogenase [NAD] subunit alpha, mitochondrial [Copidosoma floridanum]